MASTVSENGGDSIEEVTQETDSGEPKLNGEINGSCEEPMEVDDSPVKSVKKVNSSDVNCIEENDRTSKNKETNLRCENSVENMDTAVSDEVPENGEATNSNGVEDGGDNELDGEDNNEDNEEENNQEKRISVNIQERENNEEEEEEEDGDAEDVTEAHKEDAAEDTNEAEVEDSNEAEAEDSNEAEAEDSNEAEVEDLNEPKAEGSNEADDKQNEQDEEDDDVVLINEVSGKKLSKQGKKEPTLVTIDINSILSGKGPIPVGPSPPMAHASSMGGSSRGSFSVLPMALPAQGMYPQGMRPPSLPQLKPVMAQPATPSPPPATPKPVILPSLTDDMYVVEALSFIVPYVYKKPPTKPLNGYVEQVEQAIKEIKALIEKEKEREKEEKAKEAKAKEDKEKEEKEKEEKKEKESSDYKEKDDGEDEKMDVDTDSKDDSVTEIKDDDKEGETKSTETKSDKDKSTEEGEKKKSSSYFDNPLDKFCIQIGFNLVQEHVQTDLLRSQKRKKEQEGKCTPEEQQAMNSLIRSLEYSKETNEPFKLDMKKCEYCSFKTESALVMAHHLETPHIRMYNTHNYVYKCNFCSLEMRSSHDILYHMEAEHNVRGRLERAPAFHQSPSCPFEHNHKGKLSRHLPSCAKKYRPERNQEPPLDFKPPAKIPRVSRTRPAMSPGNTVYQAAKSGLKQSPGGRPLLPKLVPAPNPAGLLRGRGRPQMINRYLGDMRNQSSLTAQQKALAAQMGPGMLNCPSGSNAQPPVLLPASYQIQGSQLYQYAEAVAAASAVNKASAAAVGSSTAKLLQQPSISMTLLPRQAPSQSNPVQNQQANKPGRPAGSSNSKDTFVICEICDGYIKDLEQLRNHMQWMHNVKIHPKTIYNRPPLNCQKCEFLFFTDQGLERHLLGSHGLVSSSMQEAANKGKDGGRCPVCGKVYQWKLLNHVARDHSMSLKPAHLSYKCPVCMATFGMYKQFKNHVYSAHSVAKRVMDKKPSASGSQASTSSSQGDMLKPLKINDEITIIPQPARSNTKPVPSNNANQNPQKKGDMFKHLKINDEITIIPLPARSNTKPVPSNNANQNPQKKGDMFKHLKINDEITIIPLPARSNTKPVPSNNANQNPQKKGDMFKHLKINDEITIIPLPARSNTKPVPSNNANQNPQKKGDMFKHLKINDEITIIPLPARSNTKPVPSNNANQNPQKKEDMFKHLKINDEITIIPLPARSNTKPVPSNNANQNPQKKGDMFKHLKINDEITIIPLPTRSNTKPVPSNNANQNPQKKGDMFKHLKINDEITIIPLPARSNTKPVPSNNANQNPQKKV